MLCFIIYTYIIHYTLAYKTRSYKTRSKATLYLCPFDYVLSNGIALYFITFHYIVFHCIDYTNKTYIPDYTQEHIKTTLKVYLFA